MSSPVVMTGTARLQTLAEGFPEQLAEGFERGAKAPLRILEGGPALIIGLGGSGIAGELLAGLAARHGVGPVLPVRDFYLPRWADGSTPCVFVSYSGNTAETLAAYGEARRRGLPRVVITAGGALAEEARKDRVAIVEVPSGLPPRSTLGYLFGALYRVLQPALVGLPTDLDSTVEALKKVRSSLTTPLGPVHQIVKAWADHELWVYVPERWGAVGRRWKTQSEENSKVLSHFDTVPELLHNAIVSWDVVPRDVASRRAVVFLTGPGESAEVRRRLTYMASVVRTAGAPVLEVQTTLAEPVAEMLESVWIGDLASLAYAATHGVDAEPVAAIAKMKEALGREPAR